MRLNEWCALTNEERNRLRKEWAQTAFRLAEETCPPASIVGVSRKLLDEAVERFKAAYAHHPLINNIDSSGQFLDGCEPEILVTTGLFTPQIIEELPDRYCTFAVRQRPIEDAKLAVLRSWEETLGHFLGWSKEQVHQWGMGKWKDQLEGRVGTLFYHESPHYYVADLLIPESLAGPGVRAARLHREIEHALRVTVGVHPRDWNAAKERVAKVIEDFQRGTEAGSA